MAITTPAAKTEEQDWDSSGDLEADLVRLRALVEADDVRSARAFVQRLVEAWPEERRVQKWAEVLAPPQVRVGGPGAPAFPFQEYEWLKQHAHEYPGCWLAVYGDRLIAADPDLDRVYDGVDESLGHRRVVIFLSPGSRA